MLSKPYPRFLGELPTGTRIYVSGPITKHRHTDFNFPAFIQRTTRLRDLGFDVTSPHENFSGRTDLSREEYMDHDIFENLRCVQAVSLLPEWWESEGSRLEAAVAQATGRPVYGPFDTLLDPDAVGTVLVNAALTGILSSLPEPGGAEPWPLDKTLDYIKSSWAREIERGSPRRTPAEVAYLLDRLIDSMDHNTPAPAPAHESILDEAVRITGGARRRDYDHPLPNHRRIGQIWAVQLEKWYHDCIARCDGDSLLPVPPRTVAMMQVGLKLAREVATPKRDNAVDIAGYAYCADEITHTGGDDL